MIKLSILAQQKINIFFFQHKAFYNFIYLFLYKYRVVQRSVFKKLTVKIFKKSIFIPPIKSPYGDYIPLISENITPIMTLVKKWGLF